MREKKRMFILLAAGIVLIALGAVFTSFAGRLLVLDEPPRKADVIVVLGGDSGERVERAVSLYRAGYAPYMIVSGGQLYRNITQAGVMKDHAVSLGVPADKIILENRAESTYDNATFCKEIIDEHGFKSVMVVSSNYHMQRVKFIFRKVFKNSGTTLVYCAAQEPKFNPNRWWANNKSIMYTITEYIKFTGYALGRNI
ncbi:MAG: hypothetical protein VR69_04005 [Peptococcaceae bacterium BRH_c4b]|nr:MAG: hypothetical protein VR69_04005 [Peptococcaceae bacterium BRH_c4b]